VDNPFIHPPRRDGGASPRPHPLVGISYRDIGKSPRRDTAVERGFDGAPIRQVRAEDGLESRAV